MPTVADVRTVAPALEKYTQDRLLGEVWKRPGLVPRDRSIVTLSALIARNQALEMPSYLGLALDNGVTAAETRFEPADGVAQRRLRDAELGGGPCEAALACHDHEGQEIIQVAALHS